MSKLECSDCASKGAGSELPATVPEARRAPTVARQSDANGAREAVSGFLNVSPKYHPHTVSEPDLPEAFQRRRPAYGTLR